MVEQFPIVLRGYDKDRVDEAFASAQETVNRLREQVKADDQTILELQAQLQEEKNKKAAPKSFASLGANAQQMLASAEQTSAELLERAKKDASAARATVQGQALWLLPIGVLAAGGQLCMTRAYASAKTQRGTLVVANLQYTGLIFAAIYGITVFGDELPLIAWVGMLLIVGSGIAATVLRARTGQETPQQER